MVEYLNAGADAFGLGTPLFPAEAVKQGDWTAIEAAARSFHDAYVKWKEGNAPG